jgi:hypothetical protein
MYQRFAGTGGSMEDSELKCCEAGLRSRVISKKHGFMKVTLSYLHPFEIIRHTKNKHILISLTSLDTVVDDSSNAGLTRASRPSFLSLH